jgi:hypothetical protein
VKSLWRNGGHPLDSHGGWRARLDPKNRRKGTSAPTLAEAWAGPLELFGALRYEPALEGLRIDEIIVEGQSAVDEFSGPRNHDLIVRGQLSSTDRVVVCIEAKAGETLGASVGEQCKAAGAAKSKNASSNAPARLDGLLKRFVPYPPGEPRVQQLRYQLLTALAGTLSEAESYQARHAVLMIHEFLTDERDRPDVVQTHDRDLWNFCTTVLDLEPPGGDQAPWCVSAGPVEETADVQLYLARAVTDLRTRTLEEAAPRAEFPGHV